MDTCLEEGVAAISLFWGEPTPVLVDRIHAAGSHVLMQVGSVEEARSAVDVGVDLIVAQGFEAGGHVRGDVATMALTLAVVDAVAPTPVIAAVHSQALLNKVARRLNERPRETLGFETPAEKFDACVASTD